MTDRHISFVGRGKGASRMVSSRPSEPRIQGRRDAVSMRMRRDALLLECDWTQLPDVPAATRARWAAYRQALREVPSQAGFPDAIEWPVPPHG